jgi:hypothetical protein
LLFEQFGNAHFDIGNNFLLTQIGSEKVALAVEVIVKAFVGIVVDVKNSPTYIY